MFGLFGGKRDGDDQDGTGLHREAARACDALRRAARRGVEVPPGVAGVVFRTEAAARNGPVDPKLRAEFWHANATVRRVAVAAPRAQRFYRHWFYGILAVLLAVQVYVLLGTGALEKIENLRVEQLSLVGEIQAARAQAPVSAREQAVALGAGGNVDLLRARVAQIGRELDAQFVIVAQLLPTALPSTIGALPSVAGGDAAPEQGLRQRQTGGGADELGTNLQRSVADAVRLSALATLMSFLGQYVLTALYGLLGACAFVLRRLSDDLAKLRFAQDHRVRYTLRLHVGLLSGLAIGWFVDPVSNGGLATLSPMALAFIAGYGGDLLFSVLDRGLDAFGPREDKTGEPSTAEPPRDAQARAEPTAEPGAALGTEKRPRPNPEEAQPRAA